MEGVAGIVKWQQTTGGESLYEEGRKLYTQEINAAVRGAKAAGATEIVVMDCHGAGKGWTFNSLLPEDLDPDCEFVVQNEWTEYTAFLESGCDAALFVGMHARAGTRDGVMNHTISGRDYQNLWFNDTLVGETGINAALCGTWGCPVVLVTGDEASCREARDLLGDGLTTATVKWGLGSESARTLTPVRAREHIEEAARAALADLDAVAPYDPGRPCEVKAEFKNTDEPDRLRFRPGLERLDDRVVVSRAATWWEAWRRSSTFSPAARESASADSRARRSLKPSASRPGSTLILQHARSAGSRARRSLKPSASRPGRTLISRRRF
jgi:D-amino peptidase